MSESASARVGERDVMTLRTFLNRHLKSSLEIVTSIQSSLDVAVVRTLLALLDGRRRLLLDLDLAALFFLPCKFFFMYSKHTMNGVRYIG